MKRTFCFIIVFLGFTLSVFSHSHLSMVRSESGNGYMNFNTLLKTNDLSSSLIRIQADIASHNLAGTSLLSDNTAPVVAEFPDQTIMEGETLTSISLDNYVTDNETPDVNIHWSYFGNSEIEVSITNRIAAFTLPDINWSGIETITFIATDDDPTTPLSDSGSATFTVTAIDDAPVISGQDTISIEEDHTYTVTIDDLKYTDPDDSAAQIAVSIDSGDNYSVSGENTIVPDENYFGTLAVPVTINDGELNSNTFNALVTITSVNDAPYIYGQTEIYVNENTSFPLNVVDLHVYDPDNTKDQMNIIVGDGENYTVTDGNVINPTHDYYGLITIPAIINDGQDNSNTYYVSADIRFVNDAPVITDIPNQSVIIGNVFATIQLDNYVSDAETSVENITWTYTGNSELTVSIINRVATVTIPNTNWTGSETIFFTATDDDLENPQSTSDEVKFTVIYVNSAPVMTSIPDQTKDEGISFAAIHLDLYISDNATADEDIIWSFSGNINLQVTIQNRIATISPLDENWNGNETIIFIATDDDTINPLTDRDTVLFTINPINDAPFINIPDQTIIQGGSFDPINLDLYVSDDETPLENIKWGYSGNSNLNLDMTGHIVTITPINILWLGFEKITFSATDDNISFPLSSNKIVTFKVIETTSLFENNDDEQISLYPNPTSGALFITTQNMEISDISIEIISIDGQTVYLKKQINNEGDILIDMENFGRGTYIVKIVTKKIIKTFKIGKF
jgi:hypothetical protein